MDEDKYFSFPLRTSVEEELGSVAKWAPWCFTQDWWERFTIESQAKVNNCSLSLISLRLRCTLKFGLELQKIQTPRRQICSKNYKQGTDWAIHNFLPNSFIRWVSPLYAQGGEREVSSLTLLLSLLEWGVDIPFSPWEHGRRKNNPLPLKCRSLLNTFTRCLLCRNSIAKISVRLHTENCYLTAGLFLLLFLDNIHFFFKLGARNTELNLWPTSNKANRTIG